ncbi:CcdB family protein [Marinobacter sp. BGYM27]|nr:CcdB family protein [Marinobacter sp. BGYM27]MDG5501267.1 CcdB family protein [Marinobacter sp. BGYM27]
MNSFSSVSGTTASTAQTHYPYLVDVQRPRLTDLATRIVIPVDKRGL